MSWVIVDLDGTLCDTRHRNHLAEAKNWDEFHALCLKDPPIVPIVRLIQSFDQAGYRVGIATGRDAAFCEMTQLWLLRNHVPYDELQMRATGDHRPAVVVKAEMYEAPEFDDIFLVIEDDERLVEMWRTVRGVTCLQVRIPQ